jgi:hypothetical protein
MATILRSQYLNINTLYREKANERIKSFTYRPKYKIFPNF